MLIVALVGLALLAALSLTADINHDEGQYVAAANLVGRGLLPYRDFAYLQTPLQPLLLAPIADLTTGIWFPVARLINAMLTAAAIALLGWTAMRRAREGSGARATGIVAMTAILTSDAILFGGSVARNDALPLLFYAAALAIVFDRPVTMRGAAFAGLALALASMTKISYALPAAALGLWWAKDWFSGAEARARVTGYVLGGLAGLALVAPLVWLAPNNFVFDVFTYNTLGVEAWQAELGRPEMLGLPMRIARFAKFLVLGPAVGLAIAAMIHARRQNWNDDAMLLWLLVAAGVAAALLPAPTYRQYLVPLLPPLVLLGAPCLVAAWRDRRWRSAVCGIAAIGAVAGLIPSTSDALVNLEEGDWPAIAAARDARAIGRMPFAKGDAIAGLRPELFVDSGLALDPRFAPGPFLFRMGSLVPCETTPCSATSANLASLKFVVPTVVVIAREKPQNAYSIRFSDQMTRWTKARSYRAMHRARSALGIYAAER